MENLIYGFNIVFFVCECLKYGLRGSGKDMLFIIASVLFSWVMSQCASVLFLTSLVDINIDK